jgi:hypothetical protein
MEEYGEAKKLAERESEPTKRVDQYYCVEFAINGFDVAYQFKIWNKTSNDMSILVKENSNVLPRLKVGDTLNIRYYSTDLARPSDNLETVIRYITKNNQGRLKGHYLVGLELLETEAYRKA